MYQLLFEKKIRNFSFKHLKIPWVPILVQYIFLVYFIQKILAIMFGVQTVFLVNQHGYKKSYVYGKYLFIFQVYYYYIYIYI